MTWPARHHRQADDGGFTVIELLVTVVIVSLVIGAIASAMIVAFNTETTNTSRISDAVNIQLTQDYFIRDVQGADYVTTYNNASDGSFSSTAPEVCTPGTGILLVALYHPASTGGTPLDVGYWIEGSGTSAEIDRYQCAVDPTTHVSSSPSKIQLATVPPGTSLGSSYEAISGSASIQPAQFSGGASLGWTPVAAFTFASNLSSGTLTVGTPVGFTFGTTASGASCSPSTTLTSASGCIGGGAITIDTTSGPQQVKCTGFDMGTSSTAADFTGCGSISGTISTGSLVTQSDVQAVQLSVSEPASSYHYHIAGAPRASAPELAASNSSQSPTLLTLGAAGINPGHGGGGHNCPDGITADICVGDSGTPGVVVDTGGTVFCTGGGIHTYIHFQNNDGTVSTTASPTQSSCNTVAVAPSSGVPDALAPLLPNNGCLLNSYVKGLSTNPSSTYDGSYSAPGVWTSPLSGTLEPGVYIVEKGIGAVTEATYSASDTYFNDPSAGVLLYFPPTSSSAYPSSQRCYYMTSSTPNLGGSVAALAPLDAAQSRVLYSAQGGQSSSALSGVWLWQDKTNTATISTTGYTDGGELYARGAQFSFSGNGTLSTGSMVLAGVNWNGTDGICLNWPTSSNWNDC